MNKSNNKGFTLVELLVTLGIAGIVITLIFNFLIINLKTFNQSSDEIALQEESQRIMNKIIEIGMESTKVKIDKQNGVEKIIFINKEEEKSYEEKFTLSENVLKYNGEQIGKNIKYITITPVSNEKGIKIKIGLEKNKAKLDLENQFLLRNK